MAGAGVGGRLPAAHVDADVEQAQLSRDDAAHLGAQHSTRHARSATTCMVK